MGKLQKSGGEARRFVQPKWISNEPVKNQFVQPRRHIKPSVLATDAQIIKQEKTTLATKLILIVFMVSVLSPISFDIGPIHLSVNRLLLCVACVPCLFWVFSGRSGRILSSDIFVVAYLAWLSLSLFTIHSFTMAIQAVGSYWVEAAGSYFLARATIRQYADFLFFVKLLFFIVLLLFPLAVYESLTGHAVILEIIKPIFNVHLELAEKRAGLYRAQVTFEHPILFGVFVSSAFALSICVLGSRSKYLSSVLRGGLISSAVFCSLSTGAYLSVISQILILMWDRIAKSVGSRWYIFAGLVFMTYIIVDMVSSRTPFEVFISYLTFNEVSSYNRILIWKFGTAEVYRHPLIGIGFNDWTRPPWMADSFDNFWLLQAMRYGLPAMLFYFGIIVSIFSGLGKLKTLPPEREACRKGILVTIGGLAVSLVTVDLWSSTYSMFLFLLGSGLFLMSSPHSLSPVNSHEDLAEEGSIQAGLTGKHV